MRTRQSPDQLRCDMAKVSPWGITASLRHETVSNTCVRVRVRYYLCVYAVILVCVCV